MPDQTDKQRKAMFAKESRHPNTIPESVLFAIVTNSDDISNEDRNSIWQRTIDLRDKRLEALKKGEPQKKIKGFTTDNEVILE